MTVVIGLISGTSIDAIDVAAARFAWDAPGAIAMTPLGHRELPWPAGTERRLRAALPPAAVTMGEVCALDILVGEAFADAALAGVALAGGRADLVCSHGQNVFHWIEDGRARGTLQLGQPAIVAERTGLPVVSDLRARDVAAGGQGAPLASTLDALWLAGDGRRAALNLGGIANVTVVGRPGEPVRAYDTGPASCLLDIEAQRLTGRPYDADGALARAGRVDRALLARLLEEPYYRAPPPKSTGRELFHTGYVAGQRGAVDGADLMATLTELTAATVADACRAEGVKEVVASGGGVRNGALMDALRRRLDGIELTTSEARGLPSEAKEAYLFALLGFLTLHGLPGTAPGATGGAPRVLGRITPGAGPLVLPEGGRSARRLQLQPMTAAAWPCK